MDPIVTAAMAKWPNVPHCFGWLGLDARGDWYLRDDRCQAAGPFAADQSTGRAACKGSRLQHEKLIGFIRRNYQADAGGQWFFQNGPQRVYVELERTPYVWRVQPGGALSAHTEEPAGDVWRSLLDESGRLYLATRLGWGIVHSLDMWLASEMLENARWPPPESVMSSELPLIGGFVRSPLQARQHAMAGGLPSESPSQP